MLVCLFNYFWPTSWKKLAMQLATPSASQETIQQIAHDPKYVEFVKSIRIAGRTAASKKLFTHFDQQQKSIHAFLFCLTTKFDDNKSNVAWVPYLLTLGDDKKYQETQALLTRNTGICGKTWTPGQIGMLLYILTRKLSNVAPVKRTRHVPFAKHVSPMAITKVMTTPW